MQRAEARRGAQCAGHEHRARHRPCRRRPAAGRLRRGHDLWAGPAQLPVSWLRALLWWKRPERATDALREHFFGAFRAGLRFTRAHSQLHVVLAARRRALRRSAAASGRCCRWSRKQLLHGGAASTACCWAAWASAPSLGALIMPRLQQPARCRRPGAALRARHGGSHGGAVRSAAGLDRPAAAVTCSAPLGFRR